MHAILTPVGSSGDVHPFVGIGRALQRRGHDVTVVTAEPFRDTVEGAGMRFEAHGTTEDFDRLADNPDLWHPLRGLRLIMRTAADLLESAYDHLCALHEPGRTVIVAHTLAFAARVFEERHGATAVTVHLAPSPFRSLSAPPAFAPGRTLAGLPRWLKRGAWRLADAAIDPCLVPALNRLRQKLHLPLVRRPFAQWIHSPRRVIGLFPSWFGPPQPDWPEAVRLTGFVLFDQSDSHPSDPELEAFVADGGPPLVFTSGSAHRHGDAFFETAIEAARLLDRRAVLLTRHPDHLPARLPPHVRHEEYIPFSQLLPHCAAIVHHGGIGTCAQGLAAGIPQLVSPMAFDQPDNATRLHRLGVGCWLTPRNFTPPRVAGALRALLERPSIRDACRGYAERVALGRPLDETCALIEEAFISGESRQR